ncbi:MAG: class I SAM-dependent methyltransferase [Sphingopyxis sp.]
MTSRRALQTLSGAAWDDFGLIDSGDGYKLERYGPYRFIRPDAQALWSPALDEWDADARFVPASDEDGGGRWAFDRPVPRDGWTLKWDDVTFNAHCTPFRHLGFFPDMVPVWQWLRGQLAGVEAPQFLNLFGYTGVGSLALAKAGAQVVHVDASKKSVAQARDNAALSGLVDAPIRWIVDDAVKFTAREVRRTRRYDAILLDPPKFGRGPDGEMWRLEEHLPGLIADCARLLDAQSKCLFLTVYAVRMSALALRELLAQAFAEHGGVVEAGELAIVEETRGIELPTAIWARWSRA